MDVENTAAQTPTIQQGVLKRQRLSNPPTTGGFDPTQSIWHSRT